MKATWVLNLKIIVNKEKTKMKIKNLIIKFLPEEGECIKNW